MLKSRCFARLNQTVKLKCGFYALEEDSGAQHHVYAYPHRHHLQNRNKSKVNHEHSHLLQGTIGDLYWEWMNGEKSNFFSFFFFFSFIFISWRLITSQHFSGFCHTYFNFNSHYSGRWIEKDIAAIYMSVPPKFPSRSFILSSLTFRSYDPFWGFF